jgi:hypothetical protein
MKIFKGAIPLIFAGIGLFAGPAWASPITVANFSFESPVTGSFILACPTSWTCNGPGSSGVYTPVSPTQYTPVTDGVAGIVPDGTQAGFANVGSDFFSQTGLATIANATTYTLRVFVGHRNDFAAPIPPGTINLTANGSVFATFNMTDPGQGQWLDESLSFTTAGNPFVGQQLGISLIDGASNGQINWDNVRLDAVAQNVVPEPSTVMLLGAGLVGLGLLGRRKVAWLESVSEESLTSCREMASGKG